MLREGGGWVRLRKVVVMRWTSPFLWIVFALLATRLPAPAAAQSEGGPEGEKELETDRDSFTPATSVVGAEWALLETSYSFIENRDVANSHSFPETLLRYGLTERVELRLGWNYDVGGGGDVSGNAGGDDLEEGSGPERSSRVLYGLKIAATEQGGWRPRSAVILQGYTPTSGATTSSDFYVGYAFGWELAYGCRLDSSMRYGVNHAVGDVFNEWAPSVALRAPLTERWNVHAEYFGIYSDGADRDFNRAFFSPGTHFLVTPNLELGVRVGWGLTQDAPSFFSNVGAGWRF